jgi:AcrR family transcriptional regulator
MATGAAAITREEQKQRTRERILLEARALFLERGYRSTTIRDVARAAEVSLGLVHAHFSDKVALLRACLHDDLAKSLAKMWKTLDEDAPLERQLVHCVHALYVSYARRPELSQVMLSETLFPRPQDPPDALIGPFSMRVAGLYEAAARRGEIELADGEAQASATAFFSLYFMVLVAGLGGAYGKARSAGARATLWAEQFERLLQLQLDGVRPRG